MHLLSKFELKIPHLNPKQPATSLLFLHYELITGHFFSEMAVIFPYQVVTQAH